jgi:hypothetical protein
MKKNLGCIQCCDITQNMLQGNEKTLLEPSDLHRKYLNQQSLPPLSGREYSTSITNCTKYHESGRPLCHATAAAVSTTRTTFPLLVPNANAAIPRMELESGFPPFDLRGAGQWLEVAAIWRREREGNARETRKGDSEGGGRGKGQLGEPEGRRRRSSVVQRRLKPRVSDRRVRHAPARRVQVAQVYLVIKTE